MDACVWTPVFSTLVGAGRLHSVVCPSSHRQPQPSGAFLELEKLAETLSAVFTSVQAVKCRLVPYRAPGPSDIHFNTRSAAQLPVPRRLRKSPCADHMQRARIADVI